MTEAVEPLTAKARLALSRAELLGAMGYEEVRDAVAGTARVARQPGPAKNATMNSLGARVGSSVVGRWWKRHPLSSVVQLGQPLLERYARHSPGKLIAYGAGTGALLWVIKPWKLLSAATVVTLLFRGSDISRMVSDLVTGNAQRGGSPPPARGHGADQAR